MADEPDEIEYPGSATLDDIQNDLVVKESNRSENLTKLEMLPDDDSGHRTGATLTPLPFGTEFGRLVLVKASEAAPAGKNLLFNATIWVENEQTDVAAYR